MAFRLPDAEEIKRWIMSFGAEAVVLKPDELRAEIAAELRALAAAYREDRPRAKRAK